MFVLTPPPSKSLTNRAIILAALTNGKTIIENYSECDDTNYLTKALKKLGVSIIKNKHTLIINGTGGKFKKSNLTIYSGNAGTTLRFLTALSILIKGKITLTGSKRMLKRPIGELVDAIKQLGIDIKSNNGFPPVKVQGGKIKTNSIVISSEKSSQFISALLLILPAINEKIKITVKGKIPSIPYLKLTLDVLEKFGVKIHHINFRQFYLDETLQIKPTKIIIESDASSATYFLGAAAILKKEIEVIGINKNSKQADVKFIHVLEQMGCEIKWKENSIILKGKTLRGIEIDMNDAPDSVPTLAVVSLFAKGKTKITNIANLKFKESDRIEVLRKELSKLGAEVKAGNDFIEVEPKKTYKITRINSHNDHRIAMSFAMASIKLPGLQITNPNCIKKSFPNFWSEFNKMKLLYKL